MTYSIIVIAALLAILISNIDLIASSKDSKRIPGAISYRLFLLGAIVFFLSDISWGLLYDAKLVVATYVDTIVYFLSMAFSVVAWCEFVVNYLEARKGYRILMYAVGAVFILYTAITIIINFFTPILFALSSDCVYDPGWSRYNIFSLQITLFFITGVYGILAAISTKIKAKRPRYLAISFSALIMVGAIVLQTLFSLWPFYTIGLLLSLSLLRTFLVSEEKIYYRNELRESESREQKTIEELEWSKNLTYHDSLTGVYSRHAYVNEEERIDTIIREGKAHDFAVIVFDLNNLKAINDSFGHEAGDKYIILSAELIKEYFPNSKIYRFGGDEFVTLLEGEDFVNRGKMLKAFEERIELNARNGQPVIATGMSIFLQGKDNTFRAVFTRADKGMYRRKMQLKGRKEDAD